MINPEIPVIIDLLTSNETGAYAEGAAHDMLMIFKHIQEHLNNSDVNAFREAGLIQTPDTIDGHNTQDLINHIDNHVSEAFAGVIELKKWFDLICEQFDYEPQHTNWIDHRGRW